MPRLSKEDLLRIESMLAEGLSQSEIARRLGVNNATICKELQRGGGKNAYSARASLASRAAGTQNRVECIHGSAIFKKNPALAQKVAELILQQQLSPEQVANRLKSGKAGPVISVCKGTIYNAVYRGDIPGVTRETLDAIKSRNNTVKLSSGGQLTLPAWLRERCGLRAGDVLFVSAREDGTILLVKK